MRDRVTPAVHAAVLARDLQCFAYRMDRRHICKDAWGRSHSPYDLSRLTLDHVKDAPALGKRAPSDMLHLVAMCAGTNIGVPSKAIRQAEREYLAGLYPAVSA
jgi:hypothetical protein